MSESLQLRD